MDKNLAYMLTGILLLLIAWQFTTGVRKVGLRNLLLVKPAFVPAVIPTGRAVKYRSRSGRLLTARVVGNGTKGIALRRSKSGPVFYRTQVVL